MSKLRELRKNKKLSQSDLGEIIGVHQVVISNWEIGRTIPRPHRMQQLEDYFGVDKEAIFFNLYNNKKL